MVSTAQSLAQRYVMSQTVEILHDLIGFATVSRDPNRALIDYVADRLDDAGISATVIPDESNKKANLFASIGPTGSGPSSSGHQLWSS
jgi:acetylornithine deacetylase